MARTPMMSHWWNVPLYVTARGLTTSLIPADGRGFQIDFDFVDPRARHHGQRRQQRSMPLEARPVADFYADVMAMLDDLGLATPIWTMPVEIPDAIPFDKDHVHASYDRDQVERFWRALVADGPRVRAVPRRVRRQGQPRAPVLGRARPRRHPLLRPAAPRRTPAARPTAART